MQKDWHDINYSYEGTLSQTEKEAFVSSRVDENHYKLLILIFLSPKGRGRETSLANR